VIGIGNVIRGDDGAGIAAARRLQAEVEGIDTIAVNGLTADLAETVSRYDRVVFVDASTEDSTVDIRDAEEDGDPVPRGSHTLSPGKIVALARMLYGRAPRQCLLAAIPGREFGFSEQLSPAAARDVDTCVHRLRQLLSVPVP
jgi:hydrogenase maturation protease